LTQAQASFGILRARKDDLMKRPKLCRQPSKATQQLPVHFYYAYALSREGMDSNDLVREYPADTAATMRAELKRAIELNPSFPNPIRSGLRQHGHRQRAR